MPSKSIDFLFSLLTLSAVGMILTASINSYCGSLKASSEDKELESLLENMRSEVLYALLILSEDNATLTLDIKMPPKIGDKYYWIRMSNDSSSAWIEGGFGISETAEYRCRVYLPRNIRVSGIFESQYATARLVCYLSDSTPTVILGGSKNET